MRLVDDHHRELGVAPVCVALNVSRATWYRRRGRSERQAEPRSSQPIGAARQRRLGDAERRHVLEVLCGEEFADRSPREVYAALLSRGEYLCSIRTMYRILWESKAVRERRAVRPAAPAAVPRLVARARNEVWSWDITKLPSAMGGWYSLYVILDLYSRFVVGWCLQRRESGLVAAKLVEDTVTRWGVDRGSLTLHADRGAPMTSQPLAQLLSRLDLERSHSRPRTSNDNAFSEAQFKTMKYVPAWPQGPMTYDEWSSWCPDLFEWYNERHHHEGIGLYTPAQVFFGDHETIGKKRQRTLDAAFKRHPERFVNGRPLAPTVPQEVWINRPPSPFGGSRGAGPATEAPRNEDAAPILVPS